MSSCRGGPIQPETLQKASEDGNELVGADLAAPGHIELVNDPGGVKEGEHHLKADCQPVISQRRPGSIGACERESCARLEVWHNIIGHTQIEKSQKMHEIHILFT